MMNRFDFPKMNWRRAAAFLIPLISFWIILLVRVPYSFSRYFHAYSPIVFLAILISYFLIYRIPGKKEGGLFSLGFTMALFALTLSYQWSSGFSDNLITGGLLPYKDSKNYYYGASLILNGLPMLHAEQATERPLFPGFLSSILWLTGHNLKTALAVVVQLEGIGLYLSALSIRRSLGALATSLYSTLMYFYIQTWIGYSLSESLGFTMGCLAFVLLWNSSRSPGWLDLILGATTLMVAVSARAGAFFIFPMLAVWTGWIFRAEKRFSMRSAACALAVILSGYFIINSMYARLLGIPSGSAFGNFSYAIYGQVRGGMGWHSAIEELGTRQPSTVYRAALEYFLAHPVGLLIGFAKSYRDFFLPGGPGIFPFNAAGRGGWFDFAAWLGIMVMLAYGIILSLKNIRLGTPSLLLCGFVGIFLSIPFIPPIDGGARFHAGSMSFFYALPAFGISQLAKEMEQSAALEKDLKSERLAIYLISATLLILTLIAPVTIYSLSRKPAYTIPSCSSDQPPFAINIHPGSYIDLVKNDAGKCGFAPEVCLSDFDKNNTEMSIDDYYQELLSLTKNNGATVRIIPALDLIEQKFHYFFVAGDKIPGVSAHNPISGCAVEIKTKNQSIYLVESILSDTK